MPPYSHCCLLMRSVSSILFFGFITNSASFTSHTISKPVASSLALFVVKPEKQIQQQAQTIGVSGYTTDKRYSQFLSKGPLQRFNGQEDTREEDEDGYADMMTKKRSIFRKAIRLPFRILKRTLDPPGEPGTLILVRHGESLWNANKTFTGWADPDLSVQGYREAEHAARLLLEGGYEIDAIFTSRLQRAIRSVWIILQEMNLQYMPVFKSWRLNERMYGTLYQSKDNHYIKPHY